MNDNAVKDSACACGATDAMDKYNLGGARIIYPLMAAAKANVRGEMRAMRKGWSYSHVLGGTGGGGGDSGGSGGANSRERRGAGSSSTLARLIAAEVRRGLRGATKCGRMLGGETTGTEPAGCCSSGGVAGTAPIKVVRRRDALTLSRRGGFGSVVSLCDR